jgi:integrase
MKSKVYLDNRHPDKKGLATLKIKITKRGTVGMISLFKILPSQWKDGIVIDHPNAKILNSTIKVRVGEVERLLLELSFAGELVGKTGTEICNIIRSRLNPELPSVSNETDNEFFSYYDTFLDTKQAEGKRPGTVKLYKDTLVKIKDFCKENNYASLCFADINKSWICAFEAFCLRSQKQNTASRHLRDIRAVFNSAIDENITTNYPFRKLKIKKEETKDKSFTAAELRSLFNYPCYEGGQQEAVDMFKLMFCLIGINSVDLANATEVERGRLNYTRAKTHKPYSIKIEPEALRIIEQYKGKEGHLVRILETSQNYKTYFNRMGKTLRKVGLTRIPGKKNIGKAILPDICTGSARTSWSTIAQEELDIPREIIAAALGHHTVDVTSTYLRTDWRKKVDDANRKVIDWVFYKKATKK